MAPTLRIAQRIVSGILNGIVFNLKNKLRLISNSKWFHTFAPQNTRGKI